jgi:Cu2+-exporting ATPase
VYAGTIVEEGELEIRVLKTGGERRIDAVLRHIEESETAKAGIQSKYERIADSIVPYNFLLALLVYLFTRDTARAGAVLLVDYSCALRLATPLTILAAMSEAARRGMLIKGGRALEALHEADTAVFDKTGTLTEARPEVAEVIPFGKYDADDVLRLAACLEEHFPHPVGRAVVKAAERKGLKHLEEHAKVEFIVAHGLASRLRDEQALIGSEHFVVEDMGIVLTAKQKKVAKERAERGESLLYLATGKSLTGLIVIRDNVRPGMPEFIAKLRQTGLKRIVMLTGDGETTAAAVARQTGVAEFRARLLPEQKAEYIADLQAKGARVLMMGDGINDAPALSTADVGVALKSGTDLTREVADVVLTRGNPADVLPALMLAEMSMRRIRSNFYLSVGWNSLFLAAALGGILSPGISAFLHNASTAALAVRSMTPFLPGEEDAVAADSDNN